MSCLDFRKMGSFAHIYDVVLSKVTGDLHGNDGLPKIPPLPIFQCDFPPDTAEHRIFAAQLRKQKEDFTRDMVDYTARMEKIYKKGGDHIMTNSSQGYRIKSFGFTISTWVTNDLLNIKVKFCEPKTKTQVIMKRCLKRKFRLETIGPEYTVTKWLFIKTPWKVYAKDLQMERNHAEDDGSIIIRGPVAPHASCTV